MGFRISHISLVFLLLLSCKKEVKDDCFSRPGELVVAERHIDSFSFIDVGGKFDLTLVQDSVKAGLAIIEGPENMIQGISLLVQNHQLRIKNDNHCQSFRNLDQRIRIQIYVHQLCSLNVEGAATVTSENQLLCPELVVEQRSVGDINLNINSTFLVLHHREAGTVNLEGYVAVFVPNIYNTGILDARKAVTDYAFVYHFGLNLVHISPVKGLNTYILNKGDVFYYRDPLERLEHKYASSGRAYRRQ